MIDALIIAVLDCALMYVTWLIGMATGSLDAAPQHWLQILYLIPLFFLDGLTVIALPLSLVYLNAINGLSDQTAPMANAFIACLIIINWLYHAISESSAERATIGKRFFDLQVVSSTGKRIDFITATIRHFCKILSSLPAGIGALPIVGPKRKNFHDLIAKCDVCHMAIDFD